MQKPQVIPARVWRSLMESLRAHELYWFIGYGTVMLVAVSLHVALPDRIPRFMGPLALTLAVLEVVLLGCILYATSPARTQQQRLSTPEQPSDPTEH